MTIAPDSATEADGNGAATDAQLESLRAVPNEVWQPLVSKLCLSHREAQTAQLLCEGMTKPKIAESLGISRHTVHSYTARLYSKLGVHSREEFVTRLMYTCFRFDESSASVPA